MKKKSENWLKIARYDLKAAQLANDKQPEKIHDLLRLVGWSGSC